MKDLELTQYSQPKEWFVQTLKVSGPCISIELAPSQVMVQVSCSNPPLMSSFIILISFRLEFEATNNVVEYEALLLGSNIAKYLGIKMVHVIGDFDLVVCQVNGHHACKLERLKRYRPIVLLAMKDFNDIDFEAVPQAQNKKVDALAMEASLFHPCQEL